MRRAVVGGLVAATALGLFGAGAWVALGRSSAVSASRAATDQPCARAYVAPSVRRDVTAPLRLRLVATLDAPSALAFAPGGALGVVGERDGRIFVLHGEEVEPDAVIDLSGDTQRVGDGGLLGLAYAPDGTWLYAYRADADKDEVVTAYPVVDGRPDAGGERIVLSIDHPPSEQHHGGGFAFGPDGFLYIGTGDGGGLGDPRGNAQSLATLLGKVLRIDPAPEGDDPYRVPQGNPFVGRRGARPEIWAYGLRNPFRMSFDERSGDLWIGDVGQSCWEELDRLQAGTSGANLGWDHREGTHPFEGGGPGGFVDPVHTTAHGRGRCAIVAGYVYRGEALGGLDGALLYTDYCQGDLFAWRDGPGGAPEVLDLDVEVDGPVALVAGPDGEPWILSLDGDVSRLEPQPRSGVP